jgi:very-short-patch-repair endonuclease
MARLKSDEALARARRLRIGMNEPERVLWMLLRDRRLGGAKFRRQAPVAGYVADFVCLDARLVVELDGAQHAGGEQAAFDAECLATSGEGWVPGVAAVEWRFDLAA